MIQTYQSDLFTSSLTKKEQLYRFIKSQGFCATHKIIRWGSENFYNGAERDARRLATQGKIRRLTKEEMSFRGFKTKEKIWTTEGIN